MKRFADWEVTIDDMSRYSTTAAAYPQAVSRPRLI